MGTQKPPKSAESVRSDATCGADVADAALQMAEIVRVFNAEKKARGWEEKTVSAAETRPADAREVIGVKLNADAQHEVDYSRRAEVKAFTAYRF